jgi:type I restriction enzyme S subunit
MTEALLANELALVGLSIVPKHRIPGQKKKGGPDFLLEVDRKRIWIEAICPVQKDLPEIWTDRPPDTVYSPPEDELKLHWTAAFAAKAAVLLGTPARQDGAKLRPAKPGYLAKGIVQPGDAYIIAINGQQLRDQLGFPALNGVNQYPYAVSVLYGLGHMAIPINRQTLQFGEPGLNAAGPLANRNGAEISTRGLLDPVHAPISAVWAVDIREDYLIGNYRETAVVHNPHALNPIPIGLLPAYEEYTTPSDGSSITRHAGRLYVPR